MKKLFFLVSILCFHSTLCFAESCTAMPSCAELGYYRGTNIACGDDDSRYITCPYDSDYRKCVNYDCEEMGFIKDGLAQLQTWCQNIIFCKKDRSYVLCGDIDGPSTICVPTYCTAVAVPGNATGTTSCTPQNVYCEYDDPVYTAWECNAGYHTNAAGTGCDKNCTPVACTAVSVPEHGHSTATCTPRYSNCSTGTTVDTAWVCDTGYHVTSNGKACEQDCEIIACGGGVSVPSHAHSTGTCTPRSSNCSTGTTVNTGWACDTGYHKNSAGTGCDLDCTPVTCGSGVSVPSHAHSTGTCTPRSANCGTGTTVNTGWACDTGYHLNSAGTGCEQDCTAVTCGSGVSVPSNAHSTGTCTPSTTSCATGTTVNTGWACNSGYHTNSDGTGCDLDCSIITCGSAVTVPSHAHCTNNCTPRDSNCTNTGSARCTAWDCDATYHKNAAGTGCDKDPSCTKITCGSGVSVPSHAHGTTTCTPTETDCSTGTTVYTAWECDTGYHTNSAGTGCDENETCTKVTCSAVSIPAHAQSTATCTPRETDCSTGTTVNTAWACVSGYHLNAAGTGCDLNCSVNTCSNIAIPSHAHGTGSCTPRYSDCSEGSSVYTGWACDSGYHTNAYGTGCELNCAVNSCSAGVSIPSNAYGTNACTPRDANCNTGTTVYGGWNCNAGYHKNASGTGCDKDQVCTPVTCGSGVSVPSNAHGTGDCTPLSSDCTSGTTVYSGWACNSGYHENSAGTGCDADCSVVTCSTSTYPYTSDPSNGYLSGSSCTPRSSDCSTNTTRYAGFTCNSGYCKSGTPGCSPTVSCSAVTPPSNAHGTTTCTPVTGTTTTSCSTGTTVYTAWACDSGYCKSGSACYEVKSCSSTTYPYTSAPSHATLSGSSCTPRPSNTCTAGTKQYSGWTCNSGYHTNSAGTGCDADCTVVTCSAVTIPSNAHGTTTCTPKDKNCNNGTSVYTAWACDSNYHTNSAGTGCDKDCSVVTCSSVTVPSNAHGTSTCTPKDKNCNSGTTVYTEWACNTGYTTNSAGTGCEKCSDKYPSSSGWTTTKPSCVADEAPCGGSTYYKAMSTSCYGFASDGTYDIYPWTHRDEQYHFWVEWNSAECRCQMNVQLGNGPVDYDIESCPAGLYPGEIPLYAGFIWFHDHKNNMVLCEGFWGGEDYWMMESDCQSTCGYTCHADNFGGPYGGGNCSRCDYTSGQRWNPGQARCVDDEHL